MTRDPRRSAAIMAEARTVPSTVQAARMAAIYGENLPAAAQLLNIGLEKTRDPNERFRSHVLLGMVAYAGGRRQAGVAHLADARREAQQAGNAQQVEMAARAQAMCVMLSVFPVTPDEIAAIRGEIAGLDADAERSAATPSDIVKQRKLLRRFQLALLDARGGNYAAALRGAGELEGMPVATGWGATTGVLVRVIRATVAAHRGNASAVLTELGPPRAAIPMQYVSTVGFADVYSRWLRAEALRQLGRHEEALRWYSAAVQAWSNDAGPLELVLLGPSYLRRAESNEQLGNRDVAIEQYSRYRALWRDAEPATRALMRPAEERLEKLRSDAPPAEVKR